MIESDLCGDTKAKTILNEVLETDLGPQGYYISGFCDGDGSFNVSFRRRDDYRLGWKINPSFSVSQRDKTILLLFQSLLGCGNIRKGSSPEVWYLEVLNKKDLEDKVIPFFETFSFLSEKKMNQFKRFCETLEILKRPQLSRSDIVEILELQRSQGTKTRYTAEEILTRVDEFLEKAEKVDENELEAKLH